MRRIALFRTPSAVLLGLLAASVTALPSTAESLLGAPRPPASSDRAVRPAVPEDRSAKLEAEFKALAEAKSVREAHGPERRIMSRLSDSGSHTVDLLMGWAGQAMLERNFAEALDLLDQVIVMKPDFAEGYNRRATVYFAMDNYRLSLADIQTTLALEPRHFGAMAGLGAILKAIGDEPRAIEIFRKVLAVHPNMESAKSELEKLEAAAEGSPI